MITKKMNRLFDNDFARVVERARKAGIAPAYWQVIDVQDDWRVFFVNEDDLLQYESDNSKTYLFSPMFNREEATINGVPVN